MNRLANTLNQLKAIMVFSLRLGWGVAVLVVVCIAWLVLFVLFLPFVGLAIVFARGSKRPDSPAISQQLNDQLSADSSVPLIFDRRHDVSKLVGCNTRKVAYRWNIFSSRLQQILKQHENPAALDFGAGSLRDSYELARLGFQVTAVDLDPAVMERYFKSYDWSTVRHPPRVFASPVEKLAQQNGHPKFDLAIAFDVLEHLEDPSHYCRCIYALLDDGGLLFSIVPNRRSIFERYFKYSLEKQRAAGVPLVPGVPHLQFKLPSEWAELFAQCGFRIVEHDMAIGFFVNDCWLGLLTVPLRMYVTPVFDRLAHALRVNFNGAAFEERFAPSWLMKYVDVLDQLCKKQFTSRFGWNLIVAAKYHENPGL